MATGDGPRLALDVLEEMARKHIMYELERLMLWSQLEIEADGRLMMRDPARTANVVDRALLQACGVVS